MADLRLYFELNSKLLAINAAGPLGFQLPPLRQEDVLSIELSLMREISPILQPRFELLTLSGWSLRISVGAVLGTALATTTSFTVSADGKSATCELSLNVAGISALSDGATLYFEIIATQGTTVYGKRFETRYEKAVFTGGSLTAPPGDTALGLAQALRTFVPLDACAGFVMQSAGGLRFFIQVNDDGTVSASQIT